MPRPQTHPAGYRQPQHTVPLAAENPASAATEGGAAGDHRSTGRVHVRDTGERKCVVREMEGRYLCVYSEGDGSY